MDIWSRARSFAQEAAKKSQELTAEAAKRSQEFTIGGSQRFTDIVSEASKRSKELAAEASKRADQIKLEAIKRADQIKSISLIDSAALPLSLSSDSKQQVIGETSNEELQRYGVTDELREFVKEINISTFQEFPLPDDSPMSDVPTVSNVRQDLTEWQAKHATLVLSTVKEISKLRYELCPRVMKERKFWRIYFMLVNSHVAMYEKKYMEDLELKAKEEELKKVQEVTESGASESDISETSRPSKTSKSSADQDLDVFLLGDLGESDDGGDDKDADDKDDDFIDDFDKIDDSSDDERPKDSK